MPDWIPESWTLLLPGSALWALAFYLPLSVPLSRLEKALSEAQLADELQQTLLIAASLLLALGVGVVINLVLGLQTRLRDRRYITTAYSFPITGTADRQFHGEFQRTFGGVNYQFGTGQYRLSIIVRSECARAGREEQDDGGEVPPGSHGVSKGLSQPRPEAVFQGFTSRGE